MSALLKEIRLSYVGGINELITGLFVLGTLVILHDLSYDSTLWVKYGKT